MKECVKQLIKYAGISEGDAVALRRIAMTLNAWHTLECGNSTERASWAIERDDSNDNPYMVTHYHNSGCPHTSKVRIADREKGALKRLEAIMARYPTLKHYVQTDPRGASLYILRPTDLIEGMPLDSVYSRGIAVYK